MQGESPAQPAFVRRVAGGIELALKVVPGASGSAIAGPLGDRLKVRVAAPAEKGRANRALVKLLRDWLGARDVAIVAGLGAPEKTVRVAGIDGLTAEQLADVSGDPPTFGRRAGRREPLGTVRAEPCGSRRTRRRRRATRRRPS